MSIPRFAGEQLSFDPPGYLFFGDNLEVLRRHIPDESIDLIYLDPPFNSKKSYNLLFEYQDGRKTAGQQKAFDDTWTWTLQSALVYEEVVAAGGGPSAMLRGMREMIGTSDMLAYITMMTPRLIELRRVLKETGSIFLHCDATASHYLKIALDAVFGPANFVNEIIWHYRKWPSGTRTFQRNHDVIFFYQRSADRQTFNQLYMERAPSTVKRFGTAKIKSGHDETGTRVPSQTGAEESAGVRMDDVWDIGRVPPIKQLYPTEKPVALLTRIIEAASNAGDIVLDPFCGCGTAIEASQRLGRRWIGVDITKVAIDVIVRRVEEKFPDVHYVLGGEPATIEEAEVLATLDKIEFQRWALERIGITNPIKRGSDRGIDGEIVGTHAATNRTWRAIVSVKGGGVKVEQIRDLRGTVAREKADIGVFLTLKPPTPAMKREAAEAGLTKNGQPVLQILTIKEMFDGKKLDLPARRERARVQKLRLRPRSSARQAPVRSA